MIILTTTRDTSYGGRSTEVDAAEKRPASVPSGKAKKRVGETKHALVREKHP
jgi:hypothetical protein